MPVPDRRRPLCRRHPFCRRIARRVRALPACACAHPENRYRNRGECSGRVAVFTGADMGADGIAAMRPMWAITAPDGTPMAEPPRYALARGMVRHVGEPVAFVVADTLAQALDAAELSLSITRPCPRSPKARARRTRMRRACMKQRPAMSAFALRAATRPRSMQALRKPRTRSASICTTSGSAASRSNRAPPLRFRQRAPTSSRSIRRPRRRITSAARSPSNSA